MPAALVTGATSGIGHAFARALAARGYDLVLLGRDADRLDEIAVDLHHRHGAAVEMLVADLADRAQLASVADRLRAGPDSGHRPIDVLVNNAGFGVRGRVVGGDLAAQEALLDVLVRAVLVLSHAAAPVMVSRGWGTIINVSSVAGFTLNGPYSAAKAWVTAFTVGLDAELVDDGVRAVALCPGLVRTEFHQRMGVAADRLPAWAWLNADRVVRDCLDDVAKGRGISIPSRRYRTAVALLRATPLRALPAASRRVGPRREGRKSGRTLGSAR